MGDRYEHEWDDFGDGVLACKHCDQMEEYNIAECPAKLRAALDAATRERDERYPPPAWPPRIGEIVEVHPDTESKVWVPAEVLCDSYKMFGGDGVRTVFGILWRSDEGKTWRWVYRDLSDYTPPGCAS